MIDIETLGRIEQTLDFERAKSQIRATLASLPWIESPLRRGVLTHRTTHLALRRNGQSAPSLLFGWSADREWDRDAWEIGPSWYILPRRWYRELRWRFYRFAIKHGAAKAPYEGGYYSELEWWPPREAA